MPAKTKKAAAKAEAAAKAAPKAEAESTKRKVEAEKKEAAAEEPAKKEAKIEAPEEQEKDAPADSRKPLAQAIGFNVPDTTLNVITAMGGKVLAPITDSGLQYFVAGARANVGVKAGRYLYEVRVLEVLQSSPQGWGAKGPLPKQLVRVGFSTKGSPLVLGDSEDHFYFDADGQFFQGKNRVAAFKRFGKDSTIGVLINLDQKSPNKNTVSLFRDGERVTQPQAIPETLVGQALFPHVNFRNVKMQVLFGSEPTKPLPFECRALGGAADADTAKAPRVEPKDGKYEVMMPVCFPDQGTFTWLDQHLKEHPEYVELSDRKILEWAASSGLQKRGPPGCNDKPFWNFDLPEMQDFSARRVINHIASIVPRNYVVMEVRANLLEKDRKETLKRFAAPHYKKVAHVVMGEPPAAYKKAEQAKLLKDKQDKADRAFHIKKLDKARKQELAKRQKELEEAKKKAAEEHKKKLEEAKAKALAEKGETETEKKEGEGEEKKEEGEDSKKMEVDEEAKPEEEKKEEAPAEEEEDEETEPPKVELTEEEKKLWFQPPSTTNPDLTTKMLDQSFASFSIPEKAEGFDDIRYEWQKAESAKEYLKKWVVERKRTSRMDDLQPSQWFHETLKNFQKVFAEWQEKCKAYKGSPAEAEAKKKKAEAKKEDAKDEEAGDIFSVADVCDVGGGEPLFKDFGHEDWSLLQLRYEFFLLQAAFKKDVDDEDRPGIHETHFPFYYTKYFRKQLTPKLYGVETSAELCSLVKDAVSLKEEFLSPEADCEADDFATFVKLAEENRRGRQRRIDAGDESARLKVSPQAMNQPTTTESGPKKGHKGAPKGKGGKGWGKQKW